MRSADVYDAQMTLTSAMRPQSRNLRLLLAVGFVVVCAIVAWLGHRWWGQAWLAVLVGTLVALVALTAVRTEMLARRQARATRAAARSSSATVQARAQTKALQRIAKNLHALQLESTDNRRTLRQLSRTVARKTDVDASYAQLQAVAGLYRQFDAPSVPAMRGWAASPDVIAYLVEQLRERKPATVVECGSGVSTFWLAQAARAYSPETRIVALEHEEPFGRATRDLLARNGLDGFAEVRIAPLTPIHDGGQLWYAEHLHADLTDIGLLFVDGPPAATGPLARQPALEALWDKLSPDVAIVLDDMVRADEQAVVASWVEQHPEFEVTTLRFEKGAALMTRPSSH